MRYFTSNDSKSCLEATHRWPQQGQIHPIPTNLHNGHKVRSIYIHGRYQISSLIQTYLRLGGILDHRFDAFVAAGAPLIHLAHTNNLIVPGFQDKIRLARFGLPDFKLLRLGILLHRSYAALRPFVPPIAVGFVAALAMAFNYDMWNVLLIQLGFFSPWLCWYILRLQLLPAFPCRAFRSG